MSRPVTLFTGQWADLPFETICEKALEFGYDGLELGHAVRAKLVCVVDLQDGVLLNHGEQHKDAQQ